MNLEKLEEQIDKSRSLFDTLPENTIANRKKKVTFLKDEIEKYRNDSIDLFKEMHERFDKIDSIKENAEIAELKKEEEKFSLFKEWNIYNTPYEKMHLDYYLYQLHRYYKEDLEGANACLYSLMEAFKNVGIELTEVDFNYHSYASEYIKTILNHKDDTKKIHEVFESIYWKCPEIIRVLESNFKSIYFRNIKKIERYFEERKNDILGKFTIDEINESYANVYEKRKMLESRDQYTIIQRILDKEYSLNDMDPAILNNKKKTIFSKEVDNELDVLEKLYDSLLEYNYYIKYDFIVADMRERVNNKEQYKGLFANKLKEIDAKERTLYKMNDKVNRKGIFKSKKSEVMTPELQAVLEELQALYKELDNIKFNNIIYEIMNVESSVSEALKIASSNYLYFVELYKKAYEGTAINEINNNFRDLERLMNSFSFSIINNIYLSEEKDIAEIISDRYNMLNMTISKEDLSPESLEGLIRNVGTFIFADNLQRVQINKEDIDFYMEMKRGKVLES